MATADTGHSFEILERFTCVLYERGSTLHSVNEQRQELFSKKSKLKENIRQDYNSALIYTVFICPFLVIPIQAALATAALQLNRTLAYAHSRVWLESSKCYMDACVDAIA